MTDSDERMQAVEQRLGAVETGLSEVRVEVRELRTEVGGLRGEVGGLRGEVGGLRGEVGGLRDEVGGLRDEVNGLRIACEKNADDIKKIAEVQVHHGQKLDEITKALVPLVELRDLVRVMASDHERRITALEGHPGIRK
jgi:chromosome segregation ATPase